MKKRKTAKQNQEELERLTEKIFIQFQPTLNTMGYELIKYLDGEIDQQASDRVREILRKENEKIERELMKGNVMYTPDVEKKMKGAGIPVVWMCDEESIPDWVVKKQGGQLYYAALIEITKGEIEINDSAIGKEMEDLAQKWEDERKAFVSNPSFDQDHFNYFFEEEVSILENY